MFQFLTCLSVPTSPVSRIAGKVVNQCSPTNIEPTPQKNNFTQEPLRHSEPQKKHRSLRHQPFTADVACTLIFDAVTTPEHKKDVSKKAPVSPASAAFTQDVSEAISSHVAAFLGDEPDKNGTHFYFTKSWSKNNFKPKNEFQQANPTGSQNLTLWPLL